MTANAAKIVVAWTGDGEPMAEDRTVSGTTRRLNAYEADILAEALAARMQPGDLVLLEGEIGAGKSHFARALIRALADDEGLEVPSPTFTLVQPYALRMPVLHVDLYRITDPFEVDELGLEDALDAGIVLAEWPSRAVGALPHASATLTITISATPGDAETRTYDFAADAGFADRMGRLWEVEAFLEEAGWASAHRHHVIGDASTRRYERLVRGQAHAILMDAPEPVSVPPRVQVAVDIANPPRPGSPDYAAAVGLAPKLSAFLGIGQTLHARGLGTPAILATDLAGQTALLEDFGSATIAESGHAVPARYEAAMDLLARIHGEAWPETVVFASASHSLPLYDVDAFTAELAQFHAWYVPRHGGSGEPLAFLTAWQGALRPALDRCDTSWVLRDYHAPNLMWRADRKGLDRVGILDFQDALIGPAAYDVASLAQDARTDMDEGLSDALLQRYLAARAEEAGFDAEAFTAMYWLMGAQRATKVLGAFVRLAVDAGKPGYLDHLPRVANHLRRCLAQPVLETLRPHYKGVGLENVGTLRPDD
ncbi:MAG: tRNA (adenosine(37)-N6)-threonylcarbamoyltransferase complex ATPase subunit type 1 TsaE [Pseudomonadota bacterium]